MAFICVAHCVVRMSIHRCKATWRMEFKLPWREAGQPNHYEDKVDSDQWVVSEELSLSYIAWMSNACYYGHPIQGLLEIKYTHRL